MATQLVSGIRGIDTINQGDVRDGPHLKAVSGNKKRHRGGEREDDTGSPGLVLNREHPEQQISLLSYDVLGFLVTGVFPEHTTASNGPSKAGCCWRKSTQDLRSALNSGTDKHVVNAPWDTNFEVSCTISQHS